MTRATATALATLIPGPPAARREHLAAARALFTRLGAAWDLARVATADDT